MNKRNRKPRNEDMYKAILALQDIDECIKFFDDLCTVTELKSISQRIRVAKMLRDKCVYSEIVEATGASTATISRVNRSLCYGSGGYKSVLEKVEEK